VELEVNSTKKFDVAVETIGFMPNSNNKGPSIKPPPIPSNPAIQPLINEYKGNLKNISFDHLISVSLNG